MRLLLIAALLFASPASANVWTSADCTFTVETIDGHFVIFTTRGDPRDGVTCKIDNWPVSSPVASLICDDGTTPEVRMETTDGPIIFEGRELALWREGACK